MMVEINRMLTCSTGNITRKDAEILREQSQLLADKPRARWVVDIFYGYIARPGLLAVPAMALRNMGLSESAIRLMTQAQEIYGVETICFDRDGEPLEGWPFYQW